MSHFSEIYNVRALAQRLCKVGLARPALALQSGVAVLTYHWIGEKPQEYTVLPPAKFQQQMKYLHDHKYRVLPLRTAIETMRAGKPLPGRAVVLTFDDGYRSCWTKARPLLRKYHFPATFYVYPDYLSTDSNSLSWSQVKRLAQDPLFEVESHTLTHPDLQAHLRNESQAHYVQWMRHEVAGSKWILEKRLGVQITSLAYPYGAYDSVVMAEAQRAGYWSSFTVNEAPLSTPLGVGQTMQSLPRQFVGRDDSLEDFINKISSQVLEFAQPSPAPNQNTDGTKEVSVVIQHAEKYHDVQMRVGGDPTPSKFDPKTGRLSYTPPKPLADNTYQVNLSAKDQSGQFYSGSWLFAVRNGTAKSRYHE